jgi:phosphatidylglycerophosphatase A
LGSAAALPLWWFLLAPMPPLIYALVLAGVLLLGTAAAAAATRQTSVADDQAIVIDEVVGIWITLALAPRSLWIMAAGFVLFRVLDIAKPWPVSWADRRVPGVWGVMLDDVIAGVIALLVLQAGLALLA